MKPLKILYICTHNRCRSALCEAITNQMAIDKSGERRLIAKSAGSAPSGEVHPLTMKYLIEAGYATEGLTSNSWDDAEYMGDFEPDLLITVCDNAAGESCPIWLGSLPNMVKLHWGLTDPSKHTDDPVQTKQNFAEAIAIIEQRVATLNDIASLPLKQRQNALITLRNSLSN